MRLPPKDSWIRLAAGEGVTIDVETQKEWHEKAAAFRQVRGSVLAAVFEIEYSVDLVLQEIFFPGHDKPVVQDSTESQTPTLAVDLRQRSDLFDDVFLKSAPLSLARKVAILKAIADQVQSLGSVIPIDLVKRLQKVNDIRNKFAHYPISFVPIKDSGRQVLQGKLVSKNEESNLDETYLSDLDRLLSSVRADLDQLVRHLSAE